MTNFIGAETSILIGRETTERTKSNQLVAFGVQEPPSVTKVQNQIFNDQAFGRSEDSREAKIGLKQGEISFSGIASTSSIGQLLHSIFNTLVTNANTPEVGANTHTFSVPATTVTPSYTLVWKDGNETKMITGARISSFTFTVVAGDFVTYEASFTGLFPQTTTETVTFPTEELFLAQHAVMKNASLVGGFGGASAVALESMSLTIEKNLDVRPKFGTTDPSKILNQRFVVTGEIELPFDDLVFSNLFDNRTDQAIQLAITHTQNIGATATPFSITWVLPKVTFTEDNINRALESTVIQTVPFKGLYDTVTAKMIDAVLINGDANSTY